jgi:hypothetical protein
VLFSASHDAPSCEALITPSSAPEPSQIRGTKAAYLILEKAFLNLRKSVSRRPVPGGKNSMVAPQ